MECNEFTDICKQRTRSYFSSECRMLSSCLKYICLFVYGKTQMFWLAIFILGLSEGSPYIGVVGGDAYLNWTITNSTHTGIRYIKNVDSNATMIIFYPDAILPSLITDNRITYTGNLSLDIVSFTLSNITQSDAGKYEFIQMSVDLCGQALIIAENPIITGITTTFSSVVAGRDQKLNCSAESKSIPPGYNLTMISEWKRNGVNIPQGFKYNVTGTILTIINVTRSESGDRYTCRAYEDERKTSVESGEFSLTVLFGPDNTRIIPSDLNLDEGKVLNITCFAECNPLCTSYKWQKENQVLPIGSSASYVVKEVNRTHDGVYICNVNNTAIPKSDTAKTTVRVNYGPDATSVILRPSSNYIELAEASNMSVNCSADCIPACEYRWTGPGGSISGNTGLLSIPQIYRNQTGVFTCTAYNPIIASNSATANISLIVLYGPDTNSFTISPKNISYQLVEYSNFTVNCSTDCVPACQYRWTGPGGRIYGNTGMLSIPQIYRNQTGVFTCTAYNPRITSNSATANISVIVLYGPDSPLQLIPPKTLYRLEEKMQTSDIHCTSDCFPSCNFQWTGPVTSSTGVIAIGTVDRFKRGNYTCMGKNPRTQNQASSAIVTFIVIYGPDTPVLTPNITEYTLNESNHLPDIQCSIECFPGCTTYWYKDKTKLPDIEAGVLAMGDVYRNGSGTYTCQSKNMESNTTRDKSIQLVVQYRASITNFSAKDNNSLIKENDSLQLHCQVDSNPFSDIFIYNEDNIQLKKEENALKLNYTKMTAECLDAGNYTCRANNSIMNGNYASSNLQIMVACSPRLDYRRNVSTLYFSGLNSNVTLELYIIAYPDPTNVTWYHRDNETRIWQRVNYQPTISGGLFSILIQLTSQRDFGYYMVTMENYLGHFNNTYHIIPGSIPDVPQDFSVTKSGPYSLTLEWAPGFGGGHPQHFIIEYAKHSDGDWRKSGDILDVGSPMQSYILSGLQQKTTYMLRLYAANDIGDSKKTQVITANTSDNTEADVLPIGAIAGGISGAVVVVVLVILVLIFLRRGGLKSKQKGDDFTRELQTMEGPESGLVDNPVYDSSMGRSAEGSEYAVVVKKAKVDDARNLYAQVDKKNNKNKGDVYENSNIFGQSTSKDKLYENSKAVNTKKASGESLYEHPVAHSTTGSLVSKDGLLYADLMLDPPSTKNGKPFIRGLEDRTEYAEIAYNKRREPLPDSDNK